MPRTNLYQTDFAKQLVQAEGHLMTIAGVQRVLGCKSPHTAKDWLKAAQIRGYDINGRIRYNTNDIAKAIEVRRV